MSLRVCSAVGCCVVATVSALLLSGCDRIGNGSGNVVDGDSSAQLKAFESEDALNEYLQEQLQAQSQRTNVGFGEEVFFDEAADDVAALGGDGGRADADAAPTAPTGGDNGNTVVSDSGENEDGFSETTTQESGVDEADVVKTDGRYIYVLSHGSLKIIEAVPADTMSVVAEVDIEGSGRDMYLRDGQVTVLSNSYSGFVAIPTRGDVAVTGGAASDAATSDGTVSDGGDKNEPAVDPADSVDSDVSDSNSGEGDDPVTEPDEDGVRDEESAVGDDPDSADDILPVEPFYPEPLRPGALVTVVDVMDPSDPVVLSQTRFDGNVASSRMIDGELHLVLATYDYFYYDIMPRFGQTDFDATAVESRAVLPSFMHIDADGTVTEGKALTWASLYRPVQPDGFGVVTVVSMKPETALDFKAVGVLAQPGNIYSSKETLYLTDTDYDFSGNVRESTDIYKFVYTVDGPVPVAAGSVPGRVLNQYSMGEHNGFLRVATTVGPQFGFAGQVAPSTNQVYVLEEVDGALEVVGSVEDIAAGETIQSARFVGDRGYVVTFEQIDPLFTLDLADPSNPSIMGELKVPGFSTFIVPMDQDHLLTVGQYVPEEGQRFRTGVQLSIFDISDFSNPVLEHLEVIGGEYGAWSEALFNPKAFTYFAEEGLVALPISIYEPYDFFIEEDAVDLPREDGVTDELPDDVVDPDVGEGDGDDGQEVDGEEVDGGDDAPVDIDIAEPFIPQGFDGIRVYAVSADTGFTQLGELSLRFEEEGRYWWPGFMRGMFIGDWVYGVSDNGIRAGMLDEIIIEPVDLPFGPPSFQYLYGGLDDIAVPETVDGGAGSSGSGGASSGGSTGSGPDTSVDVDREE